MPQIWTNNKVAVVKDELVPAFWRTLGALQKELKRYEDKPIGVKRLTKGCNGSELRIDFDTLKPNVQVALGDPRKVNHPLETYFVFDAEAVRYFAKFKRENGSYLSPEEQEKYIINASVMQAVEKPVNLTT